MCADFCLNMCESGRFTNRESLRVGGWGAPEVNNLVYTKRQKHINANSTHETTAQMHEWVAKLQFQEMCWSYIK